MDRWAVSLARMMSARISGYNTSTVEDEGERVFLDRPVRTER